MPPRRLPRCPGEVDVEDMGLLSTPAAPPGAAVEPPGACACATRPVRNAAAEQISHARVRPRPAREGGKATPVHRSSSTGWMGCCRGARPVPRRPRRHRSPPITGPQRPATSTRWGPREFHVVEDLEELLRVHAGHPLEFLVHGCDRVRRRRLRIRTRDDGAVGVQRPFGVAHTVRTAVHLEFPATLRLEGVQRSAGTSRDAFSGRMIGS